MLSVRQQISFLFILLHGYWHTDISYYGTLLFMRTSIASHWHTWSHAGPVRIQSHD